MDSGGLVADNDRLNMTMIITGMFLYLRKVRFGEIIYEQKTIYYMEL